MTIAGILITLVYFFVYFYNKIKRKINQTKYVMFILTITISIFINIGYVFQRYKSISYSILAQTLFIVFTLLGGKHKAKIKKQELISLLVFLLFVVLGIFCLLININQPYIIPMTTTMDDVYVGSAYVEKARFSNSNIFYFITLLIFLAFLILSKVLFVNRQNACRVLKDIRKVFNAFFVFWFIELIFVNVISNTVWRNTIYFLFGNVQGKTFNGVKRYGFYGFAGLFSEQSYISVMIIYYFIEYLLGIRERKDSFFHLFSILLLVLNGSTTGIILVPFAIMTYFVNSQTHITIKAIRRIAITVLLFSIAAIITMRRFPGIVSTITSLTEIKTLSYFSMSLSNDAGALSARTRAYGNSIAWEAFFQSPLLGVGIGTTRGYGVWSGSFANFGLLGMISYIIFTKIFYRIRINENLLLILILLIYFNFIWFVWYLYNPAIIPIYIVLGVLSTSSKMQITSKGQ